MKNESKSSFASKRRFLEGAGIAASIGAGVLLSHPAAAKIVTPNTPGIVNVRDYGAVGDGTANDFSAIQAALYAAAAIASPPSGVPNPWGGGIVLMPAGRYYINGWSNGVGASLIIPANVTLMGSTPHPQGVAFGQQLVTNQLSGTVILADGGRHASMPESQPALIEMQGPNSGVSNLTIFYPYVAPFPEESAYAPYPFTIRGRGTEPNNEAPGLSICNVMLVNSWMGIDFGSHHCSDFRIENLYGQPIRKGIFVDKGTSNGRIQGVQFWSYWDKSRAVGNQYSLDPYIRANGIAIEIRRADSLLVEDVFVFGYKKAILLSANSGCVTSPGENSYVTMANISTDWCGVALDIPQNRVALVTNLMVASPPATEGSPFSGIGIRLGGSEDLPVGCTPNGQWGAVQVTNGNFYGGVSDTIQVLNGRLSLNQVSFSHWQSGSAAISASSNSEITLLACRFDPLSGGATAVNVHPAAKVIGCANYFGSHVVSAPSTLVVGAPVNLP